MVLDEMQMIGDEERGAGLEMLLTMLRMRGASPQIIGLSALMPDMEKLAEWLDAGCLRYEYRPVELRRGVLHKGTFHYRTQNGYIEGREELGTLRDGTRWEFLKNALKELSDKGEQSIIFVKSRGETRKGASILAEELGLDPARNAMTELTGLEPTHTTEQLQDTFSSGVAFHNSDLTTDERRLVEKFFRNGELRVLVSPYFLPNLVGQDLC
ncbi:DEAD/DEAH box helicase, partial [Candidatus Hydrogenedentota bacterium]